MKILIVDDERGARQLLKRMLSEILSDRSETGLVLFEANSLKKAVSQINEFQPDIVLLDIEMPEHSGLEIVDFFEDKTIDFQLIFTTAYSEYAIEAFKLNAIDYLLKPIDFNELENAIEKARTKSINGLEYKIEELKQTFLELKSSKIALDIPHGLMFVAPDDIIALVADGMYTTVYLNDKSKTLIAKPIKYFIDRLAHYKFFYKPHRSYYVNLKFLKSFSKKDGNTLTLENGMTIPLARDKKDDFLYIINEVF